MSGEERRIEPWRVSLHGGHSGEYCDHAEATLREMLEAAVQYGYQTFGVSEHAPGFSEVNASGKWSGLDIEFCSALAAAIFGSKDAVKFLSVTASDSSSSPRITTSSSSRTTPMPRCRLATLHGCRRCCRSMIQTTSSMRAPSRRRSRRVSASVTWSAHRP